MPTTNHSPLCSFQILERTAPSLPGLSVLDHQIAGALTALRLPALRMRHQRIAVGVGSRGIASINILVKALCDWLKGQGALPFIFPAMGSHGGATAEGQRAVLAEYGITTELMGVDVLCSMETVPLGTTPEGFRVFMDQHAWGAEGIVLLNRVKPHTDFSGKIESGLLKMITVGMGKAEGALETHHWSWKVGFEKVIRAISANVLATGKILAGVGVVENEFHQIAAVHAADAAGLVAMEEECLKVARPLVARIPFPKLDLLIIDELGKNISGTGMDTKIVGRGVEVQPGAAPDIRLIYARDLTLESGGNALGLGMAEAIHKHLFQKIDMDKMYANARTSMNTPMPRIPMVWPSDEGALAWLLGSIGSPGPIEQRVAWIRNTLDLNRIAISGLLAGEAAALPGWRLLPHTFAAQFDDAGNFVSTPV